mmetsp:Transcript_29894/g.94274  ORF Transcript_29894/g.94274 Transcript_29894/m.94274 type:complete len:216 (+) Transcript_29894:129-776(+)
MFGTCNLLLVAGAYEGCHWTTRLLGRLHGDHDPRTLSAHLGDALAAGAHHRVQVVCWDLQLREHLRRRGCCLGLLVPCVGQLNARDCPAHRMRRTGDADDALVRVLLARRDADLRARLNHYGNHATPVLEGRGEAGWQDQQPLDHAFHLVDIERLNGGHEGCGCSCTHAFAPLPAAAPARAVRVAGTVGRVGADLDNVSLCGGLDPRVCNLRAAA